MILVRGEQVEVEDRIECLLVMLLVQIEPFGILLLLLV